MTLLLVSFIAGMLTVLAPCILPLLPIIIGGSISDTQTRWKPFIITASLAVSIIFFTLILKATTAFIDIPPQFWKGVSGGILIFFGVITLFPEIWEYFAKNFTPKKANRLLASGTKSKSIWGDITIGAALGPVFSSCSPTYAVIIALVLPESFHRGLIYLIAYVVGLSVVLLLIAFIGQRLTKKLEGVANPKGLFKRFLGVLFIAVGFAVFFGYDKAIEGRILDTGIYDGISDIEGSLIDKADIDF